MEQKTFTVGAESLLYLHNTRVFLSNQDWLHVRARRVVGVYVWLKLSLSFTTHWRYNNLYSTFYQLPNYCCYRFSFPYLQSRQFVTSTWISTESIPSY